MGRTATLARAPRERLRWLEPPPRLRDGFAEIRERLEAIVVRGGVVRMYSARRRSVFRADDPVLGRLTIKELYNPSRLRQLWYGWLAEHGAVREYRNAVEFEARGGATPGVLAAALEIGPLGGLERVLLFTRWLDRALTLTAWLAERPGPPPPSLLANLAYQIVAAARLGLVHGRHSSENLLVVTRGGEPVLYTIDFPFAHLGSGLDPAGLARDVARIAHRILQEKAWPRETVLAFFQAVASEACSESGPRAALAAQMARELEAVTQALASRRPKLFAAE
jgi:hypothetical protein